MGSMLARFWRRLSVRLVISHVMVAFVVMVVALVISSFTVRRFLVENQLQALLSRGQEISSLLGSPYFEGTVYAPTTKYIIEVLEGTLNERLAIYGFDPKPRLLLVTQVGRPDLPQAALNYVVQGRTWQGIVTNDGRAYAGASVPVVVNQQVQGAILLQSPLSGATDTARSLFGYQFWGELVAVGLAALVALSLSQRLSWPLKSLRRTVAEMGPDRWREPISIRGPLEVEELAWEFDRMQGRIHDQMVRLEQEKAKRDALLGHVTHDLRTPLTSIRGFLEAIGDGVVSGPARMRAVSVALEETLRLQRLVNRLLEATRIQSGTATKVPVPVNQWIADTVERLGPVSQAKGIQLVWQPCGEEVLILGVFDHLVEALINVIDNAIKWAPADSSVLVEIELTADTVTVAVRDFGPGIPPEILPKVLDRFVTGDPSRTDSSGLGLSIVADVMDEHGGRIEVNNHPAGGALVSLILPRA